MSFVKGDDMESNEGNITLKFYVVLKIGRFQVLLLVKRK